MPCKHYKDALIEAAASGAEPTGELRAHLAGCVDCRAALEQEQVLFASIDADLHVAANAEAPASLFPRVRARLDEESAPRRIWATNRLVLGGAAVLVVAFFTARAVWRTDVTRKPDVTVVRSTVPTQVTAPPQKHNPALEPSLRKDGVSKHYPSIANYHPVHETIVGGKTTLEVLVPRDQEIMLAEYAEQWSLHKHPLLLAQNFDATTLSSLQVEPIQIDELDVKLLAEEKLQ
jgi:hypothetical protein